jgi:hypothetical protein
MFELCKLIKHEAHKGGRLDYTTRVICVGENEIGKIKFFIYFFSINQFFFKFAPFLRPLKDMFLV